jgi:hypothetical protein
MACCWEETDLKRVLDVLLLGATAITLWSCCAPPLKEPGGTLEDACLARENPDEYAWQLFLFLNRQAQSGSAGAPDLMKKFGELDPNAPVVWETWALASRDDKSEVFLPNGAKPVEWDKLVRTDSKLGLILSSNIKLQMMIAAEEVLDLNKNTVGQRIEKFGAGVGIFPPDRSRQEVRINRSAFDSVRDQGMFSDAGLRMLLKEARDTNNHFLISVPRGSKEIKAEWVPLTQESEKMRYFWREGPGSDGKSQVYGLVALHITTKDLPNWFWADFGHVDCEDGQNACDGYKREEWNYPVDSTTRGPSANHGSNGVRRETRGTVWENYILRGTQTEFTYATGKPTILSNPVIEKIKQRSSCISCHARASIGDELLLPGTVVLGSPDENFYGTDSTNPKVKRLQTDFMWSLVPLTLPKK